MLVYAFNPSSQETDRRIYLYSWAFGITLDPVEREKKNWKGSDWLVETLPSGLCTHGSGRGLEPGDLRFKASSPISCLLSFGKSAILNLASLTCNGVCHLFVDFYVAD